MIKPTYENIPDELKQYPQWVLWKSVPRKEGGKPTKPPYQPNGILAASNNPLTWSPFSVVKEAMSRYDGMGFVLTKEDPFVGLDFDNCRCPAFDEIDKEISGGLNMVLPEISEHLRRLNSYTEVSPSRKGIRSFLKGKLPVDGKRKGPIEIYQSGRYVTLTGHILDGFPRTIEHRQKELDAFFQDVFGATENPVVLEAKHRGNAPPLDDWKPLVEKALQSKNGHKIKRLWEGDHSAYPSQSEADLALCSHLAFWLFGNHVSIDLAFRESGLFRIKWDEPHYVDGHTYGQHTINEAVKVCTNFYSEQPQVEVTININPEKATDTLIFPDIMSGLAGEYANLYSSYLEPPVHFFYICFLACLGSFLPIKLASELNTQPRLFVILLGQSADDKKSTAIKKTIDFFQEDLTIFNVCFGVGSAEGLQKQLKEYPQLLLCLDELKQLIGKCKIDSSVLLPCINTLFESNNYQAETQKRSLTLRNVHLSILAASTIQTYEHTWDSSFTDIGFNNRLFIVPGSGKKKYPFPKKIPEQEKSLLQNRLTDIINFVGSGLEVDITDGAMSLYDDWYRKQDRSIHAKRLDTYALRFMMLLAVNEMKSTIDEGIVEKTIKLMDWQLAVRRLHDPIDADSKMAKMEEKIRRVLTTGSYSDRDLQRTVHSHRAGLWIYNNAINNLNKGNEIQRNKSTNCWELSPLLSPPTFEGK
jgi:hypothetical protein